MNELTYYFYPEVIIVIVSNMLLLRLIPLTTNLRPRIHKFMKFSEANNGNGQESNNQNGAEQHIEESNESEERYI